MGRAVGILGAVLSIAGLSLCVHITTTELQCMRLQRQNPAVAFDCWGVLALALLAGGVLLTLTGLGLLYDRYRGRR
jgi:hypothetical protein